MRTILYTNRNTKKCVWLCEKYMYDSVNSHDYEVMSQTHAMLNETKKSDFVEGIRILLKSNGTLINKQE